MRLLSLLLAACTPAAETWSEAVPLPGAVAPAVSSLGSMHGPGLGVDGGRPQALVVLDRGDGRAHVGWSQRRAARHDATPHERISRMWTGEAWGEAVRSPAVRAWVGLDTGGRAWGIRPAIAGEADTVVGGREPRPLPDALVSDALGNLSARDLRTAALAPYAGGRGRLVVRPLGVDVAVLVDEGTHWRVLGEPTSLDGDRIRAVGAPAVASAPDGQVLVAWAVAGELGADGATAAGLAVRHWDGERWHTLSDPTDPALLDPWPEGPQQVSERTRADRRAQSRWRKRWGRRNATDWPSPVAVALTGDGPVVSWNPTGGRALLQHDGQAWQPIDLPRRAVDTLALGRRGDGGLRVAMVRDGALLVHDLEEGRLQARPGLPGEGAGAPALDGALVAWRARIPGGHTVRVARWDGHWQALGTPAAAPAGPTPRSPTGTLRGSPAQPLALATEGTEAGTLVPWTLAEGHWTEGAATPAPYAGAPQAATVAGGTLVAWQDRRARKHGLAAALLGDDGQWTPLPGPGPDGAMLAAPGARDRILALGQSGTAPTALVRDGGAVVGLQHREGGWWARTSALGLPEETVAVAGALDAKGEAMVAVWSRVEGTPRLALHRGGPLAWEEIPVPGTCAPALPTPLSLDLSSGPEGSWAVAWRTSPVGGREAGPATVCRLDGDRWTTLPPAPAPTGGRVPHSSETMSVQLAWAGDALLAAVVGVGPDGPATLASRWDGTAWQPLAATPPGTPTGPGWLLTDDSGACLWWTVEATDGRRVAISCADRGGG